MTTTIRIGDRVRSFDFDGRDLEGDRACFVEGVVEGIGPRHRHDIDRVHIRVTRRVFAGEEIEADGRVFPPVNGTPSFRGPTDGVVLLGGAS